MAVILGKNGSLAFSRPKAGAFLLPVSTIFDDSLKITFSSQTWYPGDRVWIVHKSLPYKASIIKGYLYNNKQQGYARIHKTSLGAYNDSDATVINLSEITDGPFALLPDCNSVQLGIVYEYLSGLLVDIESTQSFSSNPLLDEEYQAASLVEGKQFAFQAYTTGWSLSLESPAIDTHSLGERFKTVSKDILSGSGSVNFVVDFSAEQNQLGAENYIELMAIFSDEPDATAKFYLNDVKNKALASRDRTGSKIEGDLYYECDILFTDISFSAAADSKIEGSITFVSTGPIKLKADVNALEDTLERIPGLSEEIPFCWGLFITVANPDTAVYPGTGGIASDRAGNVYFSIRVRLDEGDDALMLIKCNLRGEVVYVKYFQGELASGAFLAVTSDNLLLMCYTAGTNYKLSFFTTDGVFVRETRFSTPPAQFVNIATFRTNPITGHICVILNPGFGGQFSCMVFFDKEGKYIRQVTPKADRKYTWNHFALCGVSYDEDGNMTVGYGGWSDGDYIATGARYNYGAAFKLSADGRFIHRIVYYGSLVTGGVNWEPSYMMGSENEEYAFFGGTIVKTNNNLEPIAFRSSPVDLIGFFNPYSSAVTEYANGDDVTFGQSATLRLSDMTVRRMKQTFQALNFYGMFPKLTALDKYHNRILYGCWTTVSDSRYAAIISHCDLKTLDVIRTASDKGFVIRGADSNTAWGYTPVTPFSTTDANPIPYTQTMLTVESFSVIGEVRCKYVDANGIRSIREVETTTAFLLEPAKTPQLDGPRIQLFRFILRYPFAGGPILPDGEMIYLTGFNFGSGRMYLPSKDLDGKECWDLVANLPINAILGLRDGNTAYSPFTVANKISHPNENYHYLESGNQLTGFPTNYGGIVYVAFYNGSYDPTYLQHELR